MAQVTKVDFEYDSYDMESVLGKRWSAWDGAVNVIQTPTRTGFVRARVLRSEELEGWVSVEERFSRILALVTHDVNIPQLRRRIRSDGVSRLSIRRQMTAQASRLEKLSAQELRSQLEKNAKLAEEHESVMEAFDQENEQLKGEVEELLQSNADLEDELRRKRYQIQNLKGQLGSAVSDQLADRPQMEWIFELATGDPSPSMCLSALERVYGENCVVLDSAKVSAERSEHFSQGRRLLDMLRRLVTSYRTTLMTEGDTKARSVFSNSEFAATESDLVVGNPELRRERTFVYEGEDVEMFAHLKIGRADDVSRTIRVHFYWDASREKIAIGYCGPHLRVLNRP